MRAETITFEGPAAEWDPSDPEPFTELAGEAFLRAEGGNAIVKTADGPESVIYPGWVVTLPEGGKPVFDAPNRVRVTR
jgi:hypothetical protein